MNDGRSSDGQKEDLESVVARRLDQIRRVYGNVPLVSETLSKRAEIFIPYTDLVREVFFRPRYVSRRTVELAAISAATALGGDHCLEVHIDQARQLGVSDDEIFETMMVGSLMAMTGSQSVAFRRLANEAGVDDG